MKEVSTLSIKETKQYYDSLTAEDLCNCAYCRNYIREIRNAYPKVAEYLLALGVDIEKPFETILLEPDATGSVEYLSSRTLLSEIPMALLKRLLIKKACKAECIGIKTEKIIVPIARCRGKQAAFTLFYRF